MSIVIWNGETDKDGYRATFIAIQIQATGPCSQQKIVLQTDITNLKIRIMVSKHVPWQLTI